MLRSRENKVAFIVNTFPTISESFIIDQIIGLIEKGIKVSVFAFKRGSKNGVSEKFFRYNLERITRYLEMPQNKLCRVPLAGLKLLKILICRPILVLRVLNIRKYGQLSRSLKLIFWVEPFLDQDFDLIHCHFGSVANKFLVIKEILGNHQPMITTFYGYDVSQKIKQKGPHFYDNLKRICSLFFVMSENMKERIVALGFDSAKVIVQPVGINPDEYEFKERMLALEETVNIISVGRFVEKKGFDDLLKALAIVKQRTKRAFRCTIVGGGPLENELQKMTDELKVRDLVDYRGYMRIQDIIKLFGKMHFFVQPSKTARDGDME
jgi:colanic acid/amylovoran biosynthesis glycosyltransferase